MNKVCPVGNTVPGPFWSGRHALPAVKVVYRWCKSIYNARDIELTRGGTHVADNTQPDPMAISQGLANVRKYRWILWAAIAIYVPGLLIALQLRLPTGTMTTLFGVWVVLLCIAVGLATVVKCPRCLKPFHTNGPTFLPVRRCVHCGLHVTADKKGLDR